MKRRSFLAALSGLPFFGWLKPQGLELTPAPIRAWYRLVDGDWVHCRMKNFRHNDVVCYWQDGRYERPFRVVGQPFVDSDGNLAIEASTFALPTEGVEQQMGGQA